MYPSHKVFKNIHNRSKYVKNKSFRFQTPSIRVAQDRIVMFREKWIRHLQKMTEYDCEYTSPFGYGKYYPAPRIIFPRNSFAPKNAPLRRIGIRLAKNIYKYDINNNI